MAYGIRGQQGIDGIKTARRQEGTFQQALTGRCQLERRHGTQGGRHEGTHHLATSQALVPCAMHALLHTPHSIINESRKSA